MTQAANHPAVNAAHHALVGLNAWKKHCENKASQCRQKAEIAISDRMKAELERESFSAMADAYAAEEMGNLIARHVLKVTGRKPE